MRGKPEIFADATAGVDGLPEPAVDREVNTGSGLQLILAGLAMTWQIAAGDGSGPFHLGVLLNGGGTCLVLSVLSALAFAGSLGRNAARRRALYGTYLAALAAWIGLPTAVVWLRPHIAVDPNFFRWGWPIVMLILNPAAVWIAGRWFIFRQFPSMRPLPRSGPRGFPVIVGPNEGSHLIDDKPGRSRSADFPGLSPKDSSDEIAAIRNRGHRG